MEAVNSSKKCNRVLIVVERENGKIAPYKLIWPAYWGVINDQNITPINLDVVKEKIGQVFANVRLPASGDWPALSAEHITEALNSLKGTVEGEPVYVSGGKLYNLDDSGKLHQEEDPAAHVQIIQAEIEDSDVILFFFPYDNPCFFQSNCQVPTSHFFTA